MKVKRGLAVLLSTVMVVQMSVMAFASNLDDPECELVIEESVDSSGRTIFTKPMEENESNGYATVSTRVENEEDFYTYTAHPVGDNRFYAWVVHDNENENIYTTEDFYRDNESNIYGPSFEVHNQIPNLVALFKYFVESEATSSEATSSEEQTQDDTPSPVQNNEPQEPVEPDTTGQINIIDTSAGNSLPTAELGEALASTRTLSVNICNISPRQFSKAVQDTAAKTPDGGNLVIETNQVACFDKNMMAAFAKKSNVNIFVVFKNKAGKKVLVTIPAGYDVMSLLDDKGYCGFLHLEDVFGSKEL